MGKASNIPTSLPAGEYKSDVKCMKCNKKYTKFDPMGLGGNVTLNIDVGGGSFQECMDDFHQEEGDIEYEPCGPSRCNGGVCLSLTPPPRPTTH